MGQLITGQLGAKGDNVDPRGRYAYECVHVLKFRFSYRRVQTYSHLACVWRLKVVIKLVKLVLC